MSKEKEDMIEGKKIGDEKQQSQMMPIEFIPAQKLAEEVNLASIIVQRSTQLIKRDAQIQAMSRKINEMREEIEKVKSENEALKKGKSGTGTQKKETHRKSPKK